MRKISTKSNEIRQYNCGESHCKYRSDGNAVHSRQCHRPDSQQKSDSGCDSSKQKPMADQPCCGVARKNNQYATHADRQDREWTSRSIKCPFKSSQSQHQSTGNCCQTWHEAKKYGESLIDRTITIIPWASCRLACVAY